MYTYKRNGDNFSTIGVAFLSNLGTGLTTHPRNNWEATPLLCVLLSRGSKTNHYQLHHQHISGNRSRNSLELPRAEHTSSTSPSSPPTCKGGSSSPHPSLRGTFHLPRLHHLCMRWDRLGSYYLLDNQQHIDH